MVISQAASSSIQFFASGCWIAWFLPIWRLKTMRVFAYSVARLSATMPRPTASAAIRMRSGFMPCRMYSKPRPSSPMRSSTGISKFSKNSSFEVDRLAAHLLDLARMHALAVEVGVEQAEAVGRVLDLLQRRGARQQQHLVGDLRGGDPHLLAVDDVAVALALGAQLQLRRVEAGVRLGDGEAGLLLAFRHRRQHALALLVVAEHDDRVEAEDVHVDRRRRRTCRRRTPRSSA